MTDGLITWLGDEVVLHGMSEGEGGAPGAAIAGVRSLFAFWAGGAGVATEGAAYVPRPVAIGHPFIF